MSVVIPWIGLIVPIETLGLALVVRVVGSNRERFLELIEKECPLAKLWDLENFQCA